jgi:tetratricopeptide (TPR) repeat protein
LEKLRPHDVRALAYHCTEAGPDGGELSRAVKYSLAAAEEALAARAFADAEERFRSVLELAEETDDHSAGSTIAALCGLGEAQRDQGVPAYRETLLEASRRAIAVGDLALATRAVLGNTRGYSSIISGVDLERVTLIEEVLERLDDGPSAARAELTGLLASERTFGGDDGLRLELATQAEAMARELGDDRLLCRVLALTMFPSFHVDRREAWCARAAEATALADELGDLTLATIGRLFWSAALYFVRRVDEADELTRELIELTRRDMPPPLVWSVKFHTARLSFHGGDLERLAAENDLLLQVGIDLGMPDAAQWWGAYVMTIAWLRGSMTTIVDAAAAHAEQYAPDPSWRCAQAWALAEAGQLSEARSVLHEFDVSPERVVDGPWPLQTITMLALASLLIDDREYAARLVEVLAPRRDTFAHAYCMLLAPATWPLACAQSAAGEHDGALESMEEALAFLQRHEFVAHLPRAQLDLARILIRRGGDADLTRARAVLAEARDRAVRHGCDGILGMADALADVINRGV